MGIFRAIRPRLAKTYIEGLVPEDLTITPANKISGVVSGISLGDDGRINYDNKPIQVNKDLLILLPDDLVSLGFPPSFFMEGGSILEVKPPMWPLLDDDSREELIKSVNSGTHSIRVRDHRNLT